MNDPQRAEKLALARKKLKEFESRRKMGNSPIPAVDGRCSSLSNVSGQSMDRIEANFIEREPFQVVNSNGSDNLHIDRQTNGSSVSSMNSSVAMTNGSQTDEQGHLIPSTYTFSTSSAIEARLVQERDSALQAGEQLKQQLSDLHAHYASLHSAYSQLSSSQAHSGMEQQIIQLQSAVSVLVEEKTALQTELRTAREQCEQIATSHIKVQADAVAFQTEQELRNLRQKLEQATSLASAQTAELEQQRRLYADTQARALSVQNEKSEAQLRVRALLKEREALNEELTGVKKDLQMKALHLKQLSMHQAPAEAAAEREQIQNMSERLEALTNELVAVKTERDGAAREAEQTRKQFERYSSELSENNASLRQELETSEAQRCFFESRVQELEMQLTQLQHQNPAVTEAVAVPLPLQSEQSDELLKKMRSLEEKLSEVAVKRLAEKKEAGEQIEQYAQLVAEKNEELLSQGIKLRQLEERMTETRANETELLHLSEQLQSEKATVSRAVAQNKELKEQLIETEDRIVALTNEKMQSDMDKQAAEHQVRVLTEQFNQLSAAGGSGGARLDDSGNSEHLETNEAEALAMRNEREQELEQKLQQALHELTETRLELRHSHSRNEQMNQIMMNNAEDENQNSIHVELGHALGRVNELAAETDQLREQLAESVRVEQELRQRLEAAETQVVEKAEEAVEQPREEEQVQEVVRQIPAEVERWARGELEKKFTESMRRNAEMSDSLDKLEHINLQLQMENETIGDHVILYHQQRKIIRDRLRLKDQQLLSMEAEKQRVVERCRELQQALREVLASKDLTQISPISRKVYRTYSHSTVDEMSGDEDVLVAAEDSGELQKNSSESQLEDDVISQEEGRSSLLDSEETEAKVQRIFNILEEISTTPVKSADELHCSQCIGELKKL